MLKTKIGSFVFYSKKDTAQNGVLQSSSILNWYAMPFQNWKMTIDNTHYENIVLLFETEYWEVMLSTNQAIENTNFTIIRRSPNLVDASNII